MISFVPRPLVLPQAPPTAARDDQNMENMLANTAEHEARMRQAEIRAEQEQRMVSIADAFGRAAVGGITAAQARAEANVAQAQARMQAMADQALARAAAEQRAHEAYIARLHAEQTAHASGPAQNTQPSAITTLAPTAPAVPAPHPPTIVPVPVEKANWGSRHARCPS